MVVLLGGLHPALVHFPIALLLVGAIGLLLPAIRASAEADRVMRAIFGLGALAALLAVGSGWLLAERGHFGGSDARILEIHRWLGIGVAGVACGGALLLRFGRAPGLGRALALLAALGAGGAGYLGAELVHGQGHLFASLGAEPAVTLPQLVSMELAASQAGPPGEDEALVYRRDIRPALRRSCYKCHDASKQKGGLRLDTREAMLLGGDSGPALVPGDADASELLRRVKLPQDHEDFMPRKGSPLKEAEIAVLERWIREGASFE